MAGSDGHGYNHRSTPYKQLALDSMAGFLLGVAAAKARKDGVRCIIADMTAGPGLDPLGRAGSPLILAKHISNLRNTGFAPVLMCVESDKGHLARLQKIMAEHYPALPVAYFSDQATALGSIPERTVGLTYWDPTKYNNLNKALLMQFGRSHYYMDILITRQCLATKRMRNAGWLDTLTIEEYLELTGKKCNYIRQYAEYGWWTFGFADNWEGRPPEKMGGLLNVKSKEAEKLSGKWSPEGQSIPEPEPAIQEQMLWQP
jgi:hypothetical protein